MGVYSEFKAAQAERYETDHNLRIPRQHADRQQIRITHAAAASATVEKLVAGLEFRQTARFRRIPLSGTAGVPIMSG